MSKKFSAQKKSGSDTHNDRLKRVQELLMAEKKTVGRQTGETAVVVTLVTKIHCSTTLLRGQRLHPHPQFLRQNLLRA